MNESHGVMGQARRLADAVHPRLWFSRISIALGIALAVIAVSTEVFHLGLFQRLELASIDYRFLYRGVNTSVQQSAHVVIVEISEESFRSLPTQFPWPREYYAHVLRNLKRAGARAVGIDLIFDSPDSHGEANDSSLKAAIRESGIAVLAGKRDQDAEQYVQRTEHQDYGNIFFGADSNLGLVNIRADADGIYRMYNPYFLVPTPGDSDLTVPTIGFAMANRYLDLPPLTSPVDSNGLFLYAGRRIPQYDPASFLINYYGPNGTFKHIRFHDVIDDETFTTLDEQATGSETNTFSDPEYGYLYDGTFKDKIVLIGVTVPEYKDLFPVSMGRGHQRGDNLMYGVELHANVIENILRNDFLRIQSPFTEIPEIIFLVLLSFLGTSSFRGSNRKYQVLVETNCLLANAVLILTIVATAIWSFNHANLVLRIVSPTLAVLGGYFSSTAYSLASERRQRLQIKAMFGTYVNPSLVDALVADPGKLILGGERKELTVMFCDIEGFTSIAQTMAPEQLVSLLNEFLDAMSSIIFEHDGTVDKYEGDAIMAFWGAPVPQTDHALRACYTAMAMQEALKKLNAKRESQQLPSFPIRIGINTGEMVVGNMGSQGKFDYTVIGDSVNLASRLEGANREYRTSTMVSKRTYELVQMEILGRELDVIQVKGRSEPVVVYELIGKRNTEQDGEFVKFLGTYQKGMELYHQHHWSEALKAFEEALLARPEDYPALLHRDRCALRKANPRVADSDLTIISEK